MEETRPQTALVCDGEDDSEDEPPTPRVVQAQVSGCERNVFFEAGAQSETFNEFPVGRHLSEQSFETIDSCGDGPTPTTENYMFDVDQSATDSNSATTLNGHIDHINKTMTDSSDIEIITEEGHSSDSIEVMSEESSSRAINNGNRKKQPSETSQGSGITVNSNTIQTVGHHCQQDDFPDPRIGQKKERPPPENRLQYIPDSQECAHISGMSKVMNGNKERPNDLSLSGPVKLSYRAGRHRQADLDENEVFIDDLSKSCCDTDRLLETASSTPLQTQGTVVQDGDMIAFVAEDLQEKIKMSSPASRHDSSMSSSRYGSRTPSSRSMSSLNSYSSSSASGWSGVSTSGMSRSPSVLTQSPEDMPPVDPRVLFDLEMHSRKVAENVDVMMHNLKTSLFKMSRVTSQCLDIYREGVDHTCDSVDASIKSMYALMAKCEELSKNMQPVYVLAEQVKEIKRLLELWEGQLMKDS